MLLATPTTLSELEKVWEGSVPEVQQIGSFMTEHAACMHSTITLCVSFFFLHQFFIWRTIICCESTIFYNKPSD